MRDRAPGGTGLSAGAPDSDLALLALRYAAGELDPAGVELFEARLGADQSARDALAEAVRLSAAASGVPVPAPDPLVREAARERIHPTWASRLFPRRPYRGHPLAWAGGGGALAALGVALLSAAFDPDQPTPHIGNPNTARTALAPIADYGPTDVAAEFVEPPPFDGPPVERHTRRFSDPQTNPKLNPMGYQEHSPMATNLIPTLPVDPGVDASRAVQPVPAVMPPTNPLAESKVEPEQADPMATPLTGETKKG
jgi:hypothetical protein